MSDKRPRFGKVIRRDGSEQPLVFHATDNPNEFVALSPGDETELTINKGDFVHVDDIGPGQSVLFRTGDDRFTAPNQAHTVGPTKEVRMTEEKKQSSGWDVVGAVAGVTSFAIALPVIVVVWVAAIRYIW